MIEKLPLSDYQEDGLALADDWTINSEMILIIFSMSILASCWSWESRRWVWEEEDEEDEHKLEEDGAWGGLSEEKRSSENWK